KPRPGPGGGGGGGSGGGGGAPRAGGGGPPPPGPPPPPPPRGGRAPGAGAAAFRPISRPPRRARVRVAVFPSGGALLLPHVLPGMVDSGVEVVARDEDVPPSEVARLLADYDVVLTHRDERAAPIADPRVATRVLMREPIDVVAAPTHRLAGRTAVAPEELADETWLSVRGGFPVDDVLRSIATVTGVQPRIAQRLNDFRVIETLVATGYGVALMPRYAVGHPALAVLRLSGVRAARMYELATRPRAEARPAVAAVLTAFESAAATATAEAGR
ncbi:LysR substrate-binding domain-containing protein, partial [Nocardia asiatica]|uniref:LysR substrate-binding domain-containing protein n=1 Tax=Nocardia asiatica TaxID=209252 RepID=UPI00245857B4